MIYTCSNLKDNVFDPKVFPLIDTEITTLNVLNRAVRSLKARLDLRSAKRKATTAPTLFDEDFDYAWPTDGQGNKVIDLRPRTNRSRSLQWELRPPEEFDRLKQSVANLLSVTTENGLKRLLASANIDGSILTVSTLDDLTAGGGTWSAVGDAQNLAADGDNYVKGAGSIRWDIGSTGGTTAGIQNAGLDSFDFEDFVNFNRSIFHWVELTSETNITNFKIRIGSSTSDYYEITVTTTNEGTAFQAGWNLLRFDFVNKSTTGSPDATAGTYCSIFMTKSAGKINETGYHSDQIILEGGILHDLLYYSKYGWQTSAGVWIENATTSTDLLVADTDEFDLLVREAKIEAAKERKDYDVLSILEEEQKEAVKQYQMDNPSEALLMTNDYYNHGFETPKDTFQ